MKKDKPLRPAAEKGAVPAWVWYALCFALPAAVMLCAYASQGFYPFGDKSILVSDMAEQYVEFFCGLKHGDVFFSWSKALGTSYIGVFSYYVSSPLSLITLLFPNEVMPLGLMVLVILKLGLSGLAFAIFARHYFDRLGFSTLLCALCYSLCAYAVGYSVCVMWLDGLIWLPIILLGLEWLMDRRRRWLFPLALAVCFFSTWYISYMIGGFCCLWLLFRAVSKDIKGKELLRVLRDFFLCALWALCLTAWLWLPSYLSLTSGKFSGALTDYPALFNFKLSELFPQLFFGHYSYFTNAALPYIFCGSLALLAAAAYFFLGGIPLRQRMAAAGLTLALLLSMWLAPLDKVWHLFKYPNWFPYRYAFLLCFFLCFLALHTLQRVADTLPLSRLGAVALAALICLELGANAAHILQTTDRANPYQSYSAYVEDTASNAFLVAAAQAADTRPFYRMGATHDRGLNSPLTFGYNGITHYSSLYDQNVNDTLRGLGFAQSWYWCAYYGSTHFTDALFDIRYVITDRSVPGYREVAQEGTLGLYENPNTLPLAFVADHAPAQLDGSPVERQNRLFSALTGDDQPLFTATQPQVDTHEGYVSLTYQGTGQPIYLDLTSSAVTDLQMDGRSLFRYPSHTGKTRSLHCLGAPGPGETLTVLVTYSGDWNPEGRSFFCDLEALARGTERLNDATDISAVKNGRVELDAAMDQETRSLATTIPAEDGWSAYVDGARVDLHAWLGDTFLALDLPAGAHHVTLRYTPPGLPLGLGLGVAALAWAGAVWYLHRRKKA